MTTFRALGFVIATLVLSLGLPGSAKAALEWTFGFVGSDNGFEGEGFFVLKEPVGDGPEDLLDFHYEGTCGFTGTDAETYLCEFGLDDVDVASWILDEEDWTFDDLSITAQVELTDEFIIAQVSMAEVLGGAVEAVCVDDLTTSRCDGAGFQSRLATGALEGGDAFISPVHVPEPTTLTLFVGGLAGLLGWAWRRRRSS